MLTTYEAFIARVETLGFLPLSSLMEGFPSLGEETPEELWHTGLDTDPWHWKDRAAKEKRLAYGCILGAHKGFVTQRFYPIFYTAYRSVVAMPERWDNGTLKQKTWQLWQLFEAEGMPLTISQIRKAMGVSRKNGASAVDTAIQRLQQEYYITVDGSERKINAKGEPYGWAINRYARVVDWAPDGWLEQAKEFSAQDAREMILDRGMEISESVNRQELAKKLGF